MNQAIYPSDHIFTPQELELYKKVEQEESNVEIEYKKVRQLEGVEEYVEYLEKETTNNKNNKKQN